MHACELAKGIHMSPPPKSPSHLPPHPTPLGCRRAVVWGSPNHTANRHQLSTLHGLPWRLSSKDLPAVQEAGVWSLGREDPLEEGMETHSSILAWRIQCTEEPGGATGRRVAESRALLRNSAAAAASTSHVGSVYVSTLLSQVIPPAPGPTVTQSAPHVCVSLAALQTGPWIPSF